MVTPPPGKMSRQQFYAWAEQQPRGRYELMDGQVVAMAPERIGHARAKAASWLALHEAIAAAGVPCEAFMDGVAVEVGEDTAYVPDALVHCGPPPSEDSFTAPNPVIVVEVASPSTARVDSVQKLADYFRVPSILHYLILDTRRRMAVHHRRGEGGTILTTILPGGPLTLDPPGLHLTVEALFGA